MPVRKVWGLGLLALGFSTAGTQPPRSTVRTPQFENDSVRVWRTSIAPGQPLTFGDDIVDLLFLPGHSPGSIGFYCEAQDFLIGGDVLFREGIGRTDMAGGDHATLLQSIREQLWPLPDETVVWPGHGEPTTIGFEKKNNPFVKGG